MSEIDKRNRLTEEPFTYQITKKGMVMIYFEGKQIKMVNGRDAERLITKIKEVEDDKIKIQVLLAKITGNFKRGNEKLGKNNNSK
ncbi:hypothetical protein RGU12_10550 [Fredinandcohnia sp. QZ13]|uniref:hypothetical protein n=1 Tax=Fredinandcohnia sp. QZ13 TaxID=3073144 RepID=UPI00285322C6|nr:hypothetical protein [Fredinandcohnia sp. QZ13]MDR4887987.1 hypothetical protein [Fredinandcohnia sp. QZ13]